MGHPRDCAGRRRGLEGGAARPRARRGSVARASPAAVAGGGLARGRLRRHRRRLRPDSAGLAGRRRDDARRTARAAPPSDAGRRVRARAPARDGGTRAAMAPLARCRGRRCARDLGLRRRIPRPAAVVARLRCAGLVRRTVGARLQGPFRASGELGLQHGRRVEPVTATRVHVPQPAGDGLRARRRAAHRRRPTPDAVDGRHRPDLLRRALVDAHESSAARALGRARRARAAAAPVVAGRWRRPPLWPPRSSSSRRTRRSARRLPTRRPSSHIFGRTPGRRAARPAIRSRRASRRSPVTGATSATESRRCCVTHRATVSGTLA